MEGNHINIIIGRFQPLTNGHLKCLEEVYKETGLKTIVCIIKTDKLDERHPFDSESLIKIYNSIPSINKYIEKFIEVNSANIVPIQEELKEQGYIIDTWVCGSDRYKPYKKMADKYTEGVEVMEIKRSDDDISATMAREALKKNDKKLFLRITPIPEKYYNELWTKILAY